MREIVSECRVLGFAGMVEDFGETWACQDGDREARTVDAVDVDADDVEGVVGEAMENRGQDQAYTSHRSTVACMGPADTNKRLMIRLCRQK